MSFIVDEAIEAYAQRHGNPVPDLLEELRVYTLAHVAMPQMQVGQIEGNFLKILARLCQARRVVEVGTFTGYSALMMAAGLPHDGELITCDIDPVNTAIAQSFFDRSPHGAKIKIQLGPAAETLVGLEGPFDMAFIDADKTNYRTYFDLIRPKMRAAGLIVVDNVLWSGHVLQPTAEQDANTRAISAFNTYLHELADSDKVMLTVRDGMTLILT